MSIPTGAIGMGFSRPMANPGGLSITHLEFRRAGECGIPRLALLRTSKPDDERSSDLQDPARAPMVSGFRDEVARQVRAAEFSNRRGLIQGLSTGIQAELDKLRKRDERQAARGARPASAANSNPSLAPIADRLADAVDSQWKAEAKVRRLNDPYPLPVSWAAANASLTDTWDSLVKLASAGAGWPRPPPAGSWAASPDELAGEGGELADVLARVPTGRLVVLGEPGAGKTMLMVRLVLDLLADRAGGGPVPFLASVASWDPKDQDLRGWLGGQLLIDHPVLAKPLSADSRAPTRAEALLESRLIMPILDGLDEIPEKVRGPAIGRINEALRPGEHLVVTCRSKEYRDAVRPAGE
jgi:predicted NACHT family NTPase